MISQTGLLLLWRTHSSCFLDDLTFQASPSTIRISYSRLVEALARAERDGQSLSEHLSTSEQCEASRLIPAESRMHGFRCVLHFPHALA
jgi:hypothetical protein